MKIGIGIVVVVFIGIGAFLLWNPASAPTGITDRDTEGEMQDAGDRQVVSEGTYQVQAEESRVRWAGKKPLIEGYINSGSIAVADGTITVTDGAASGSFTIDMDTLSVSETPTKPGQESTLEGHLKGDRWFDVAQYPTASFSITEITQRTDSDTTFIYDVRGDLTLKGQAHEITFPAEIYQNAEGVVRANADFEIDRTRWGLTSGSSSFFDNLADNTISNMVALSFALTAE